MVHALISWVRGIEVSPPAESSMKRLLLLSKGLFSTPKSGNRWPGKCGPCCDYFPAAKHFPAFGIGIATGT